MPFSRNHQSSLTDEHLAWLQNFAAAVRGRNFPAGRALCHTHIHSFGTAAFRATNLDSLESEQWQFMWNSTRDFDFNYDSAESITEQAMAVLLVTWHSVGIDPAGSEFHRRGRATIILQRHDTRWLAIHTHFSTEPKP